MSQQPQPLEPPQYGPQPPAPRPASSIAALALLILVFVVGIAVGQSGVLSVGSAPGGQATPGPAPSSAGPGASPHAPADFDLFWQALDVIRQNFVGRAELDDQQLTYGAIRGLVDGLGDTGHSVFLTPEEVLSEQNALDGSVVGIGVLLGEREGDAIVLSVVSGGPAQAAGIRAGDQITDVDGQPVVGLPPEQVAARVRGEEGTTVRITISRPSIAEQLDYEIVRRRIRIPAVSWSMVPGTRLAVLRLAQFSAGSATELQVARDAAIAAGAQSLILDLRGNPGGYVDQAVDAASLFLDASTVYIQETAEGERIPVPTNPDIEPVDLRLVVLVDRNTASSAEILSGAIAAAGRAPIVGEQTFGTGTVLLPFNLADGSSIRLAVERWLTPDGELIFGQGITPTTVVALGPDDVPIEPDELRDLTPEQVALLDDPQLAAAIELLAEKP